MRATSTGVARSERVRHVGDGSASPACPYRVTFITAESAVSAAGILGAVQLVSGKFTPPAENLTKLGLSSWVLPGLWLFATAAVPAAAAAWLAWRQSPLAPEAVLLASGLLLVELFVQIPVIGVSWLQAVLGVVAISLAAAAIRSRQLGWRRDRRRLSDMGARQR